MARRKKECVGILDFSNINQVLVIDPGYDKHIDKLGCTIHIKSGKYKCFIETTQLNDWGKRISRLIVIEENGDIKDAIYNREYAKSIPVDSGTMSIISAEYYANTAITDDKWYENNVMSWCGESNYHIINDKGILSETGLGDGMYDVSTYYNDNNECIGIIVEFI